MENARVQTLVCTRAFFARLLVPTIVTLTIFHLQWDKPDIRVEGAENIFEPAPFLGHGPGCPLTHTNAMPVSTAEEVDFAH